MLAMVYHGTFYTQVLQARDEDGTCTKIEFVLSMLLKLEKASAARCSLWLQLRWCLCRLIRTTFASVLR